MNTGQSSIPSPCNITRWHRAVLTSRREGRQRRASRTTQGRSIRSIFRPTINKNTRCTQKSYHHTKSRERAQHAPRQLHQRNHGRSQHLRTRRYVHKQKFQQSRLHGIRPSSRHTKQYLQHLQELPIPREQTPRNPLPTRQNSMYKSRIPQTPHRIR